MSDTRDLVSHLQPSTLSQLFSHARVFAEKPQLKMQWHAYIASPALGFQCYVFDDLETMRRELSKVSGQLTMGSIFINYGYALPITTDGSGHNLFTVDMEGNEISLTGGYHERTPVNMGQFGVEIQQVELDDLV